MPIKSRDWDHPESAWLGFIRNQNKSCFKSSTPFAKVFRIWQTMRTLKRFPRKLSPRQ